MGTSKNIFLWCDDRCSSSQRGRPTSGDARADQGLVPEEPQGEVDQDRREGRQPRALCRIPGGRGRHPPAFTRARIIFWVEPIWGCAALSSDDRARHACPSRADVKSDQ